MLFRDAVAGLAMVVLSVLLFAGTYEFSDVGGYVSPRLFPRVVAVALFGFSIVLMVRAWGGILRGRVAEGDLPRFDRIDWKDARRNYGALVVLIALSLIYVLVIESLGYIATTVVYLAATVFLYAERRWFVIGAVALAGGLGLYAIFRMVFEVPLPRFDLF